jgi:hypothetical protein
VTSEAVFHAGSAGTAETLAARQADSLAAENGRLRRRLAELETERERGGPEGPYTLEEFLRPVRAARIAFDARKATGKPVEKVIKVVRPQGIRLPADSLLRRKAPRKPEDQQPEYREQFDDRTLFYDVFAHGDDVWLCGPPVSNLREPLEKGEWRVDGQEVSGAVELGDWGRTQRSRITGAGRGSRLDLAFAGYEFTTEIAPNESDLFAGQRAIITKSKDNDLVWIQDYLRYYHLVHGVTGVVLHDNNSTRYTARDVADAISEVEGITTAVVVDWRFPFGPDGGPRTIWDSDYGQYGMLEHGRFRYLAKAAGVISTDIDELILCDDGRSVFAHAAESETGVAMFSGYWMAKATRTPMDLGRQRRFSDYHHRAKGTTTVKWAALPALLDERTTQWRVHSVAGSGAVMTDRVHHRHFQGVNNGWRYARTETVAQPEKHVYDVRMSRVLDLVYGPPPQDS